MISKIKNKSIDSALKVGIFVESPRFLSYAAYLGKDTGAVVITNSKEVYDRITASDITKHYIPDWGVINLLSFKKKFRAFAFDSIILFSDASPVSFWIQKNYKTLMVSEDLIFGRDDLYYNCFPDLIKRCGFIIRMLQVIAGAKSLLNGKSIYFMPNRIYPILIFMIRKMVFGFKENILTLPGRYATKISVYSEAYKTIYISNAMSPSRLMVNGSISFESAACTISNFKYNPSDYPVVDVILFAQPFYKYPAPRKEAWIADIRSFVDDCKKSNISYLVALHPRDDINFYLKFIPRECIVDVPRTEEHNIGLVRSAKLVVLRTTTTIILPFSLKKPVAYINYSSYSNMNMMKHFQKEMILYAQNSIGDIITYLEKNSEAVIVHQDNELNLMCASITGVKDKIMNAAETL